MTTKESILEEFENRFRAGGAIEINSDTKTETVADVFKQFLSQSLDRYGEEKYQEGIRAKEEQLEDETKMRNRLSVSPTESPTSSDWFNIK